MLSRHTDDWGPASTKQTVLCTNHDVRIPLNGNTIDTIIKDNEKSCGGDGVDRSNIKFTKSVVEA